MVFLSESETTDEQLAKIVGLATYYNFSHGSHYAAIMKWTLRENNYL